MNVEHNLFQSDAEREQALTQTQRARRARERVVHVREGERRESDPCDAGTIGCSVNHSASGFDASCETW